MRFIIDRKGWSYPSVLCLLVGLMAFWANGAVALAGPLAYINARIWTGESAPLHNGTLLIQDGKVKAVGPRDLVEIPEGAEVRDVRGAVIIPGLVVAETTLGEKGRDDEQALTPQFLAINGFDFYGDYQSILAGGVTTVQLSPGSKRLMPGRGAVVKLAGSNIDDRTLQRVGGVRIVLSDGFKKPPTIYEPPIGAVAVDKPLLPSKPQLATSFSGAVAGIRAMYQAASADQKQFVKAQEVSPCVHALVTNMANGRQARFTAPSSAALRAALNLTREFSLKSILVDVPNAKLLTKNDEQNQSLRGVILGAGVRPGKVSSLPVADESGDVSLPWTTAAKLLAADYPVAIRPMSNDDLAEMLFLGGVFQRGAISAEEVLKMLTVYPAEMLGVADRVGSLTPGHDADFVILTGDPFGSRTRVSSVYVDGKQVYTAKKTPESSLLGAAKIYTGTGEIVTPGTILIQDGKVLAIGRDVSAPVDATRRRFPDAVIVPGFVDLYTGLGMGAPLRGSVSLDTKLGDLLVSDDPSIAAAREGGVTTVLLGPSGDSIGPVVAFKLSDQPRVVKDPVAVRFSVSGNLTSKAASLRSTLRRAKSYADRWTQYEKDLAEYERSASKQRDDDKNDSGKKPEKETKKELKKEIVKKTKKEPKKESEKESKKAPKKEAKRKPKKETEKEPKKESEKGSKKEAKKELIKKAPKEASEKEPQKEPKEDADKESEKEPKPPKKPQVTANLEPYRALFAGQSAALVEANRVTEIRLAVKIFKDEFKLPLVIVGGNDAFRLADELAKAKIPVVVGPDFVRTVDYQKINTPQILANAGIPFGFQSKATKGVQLLPLAVEYAVRKGLGIEDALGGLTSGPAQLLFLNQKLGTLEAGKDADLVVLSGPPFEASSRVLAVMIDGKWAYQAEENE